MKTTNFKIQSLDKILNPSSIQKEGSLVDQIYWVLRENIINLSLPPEIPLVEKEITDILEITKTPVREALKRLANDRLVTIVPKSGSYVTSISLEKYLEACFVRLSLESSCVKLLADKGVSMSEQVRLKAIIKQQQEILENKTQKTSSHNKSGRSLFFKMDELFHRTLFEYAGIIGAWALLDSSKAEMDRVRHLKIMMGINRRGAVIEEHTSILEAVINRDPVAAEEAMISHIGGVQDEIDIISQNPQFIHSMEEFNLLINDQRKGRNKRKWQSTSST
jgi:DNA-binding GntR family transcriptional regulator